MICLVRLSMHQVLLSSLSSWVFSLLLGPTIVALTFPPVRHHDPESNHNGCGRFTNSTLEWSRAFKRVLAPNFVRVVNASLVIPQETWA
ncbi:hypothetical protein M405DRAFT_380658 [Rhizopogon salebrosus TDB-379]|nr:hypothetical protein M405DRAFT_380658 [Rhizopogon salebrosus TDB-379]